MGEEYSVSQMAAQVTDLRVQVGRLEAIQTANHKQNRNDIHAINNSLQTLVDLVTNLRIKQALWSGGAGVLTALSLKLIDYFVK